MMAWLESHQELRDHPKTARFRRRLGISLPAAIGYLHLFWWWCLDYAQDGDLSRFDPDVIADAACWEDEPGSFVRALVSSGFVNEDMTVHDWDDYAGRLILLREANARRMRDARKARREALNGTASGSRGPDATGARAPHVQGLPDTTQPDLTGPDRTTTPRPPPHAEGEGAMRNQRGRRGRGGTTATPAPVEVPELAPPSSGDRDLWNLARDALTEGWLPSNAEKAAAFVLLGRDDAGALWLRAPPWASSAVSVQQVRVALFNAGDAAGGQAHIVVGSGG